MQIKEFEITDKVIDAFNIGYSDYIVKIPQFDKESFTSNMMHANHSSKSYSSICVDQDKIVGVILAGVDGNIAMINSLCVIPEYRGSGAAELLMEETQKKVGNRSIMLEVMKGNDRAISFYKKYGFEFTGELSCVYGKVPERELPPGLLLRDMTVIELIEYQSYIDVPLGWQSRMACMLSQDVRAIGCYADGMVAGFLVYIRARSTGIKQLYVLEKYRRLGIASALLKAVSESSICSCIYLKNGIGEKFFSSLGFEEKFTIFQMTEKGHNIPAGR